MSELSSEAKKAASGAGCCLVAVGVAAVVPSYVSQPIVEAAMDFSIEITPDHVFKGKKEALKAKNASKKESLERIRGGERMDAERAVLTTAVVLLLEVPQAIPQVLHHMAEFAQSVPNWMPEAAAVAAIAYGLSYVVMRGRRKELEKLVPHNQ